MADLVMKQNDTYPPLTATLTSNGLPIDLSNATSVTFYAKGTTVLVTGACTIVSPATGGQVQYAWAANDLATVDTYNVEFLITWNTGKTETVPNSGYRTLQVVARTH